MKIRDGTVPSDICYQKRLEMKQSPGQGYICKDQRVRKVIWDRSLHTTAVPFGNLIYTVSHVIKAFIN